jgi:hypothetical protein
MIAEILNCNLKPAQFAAATDTNNKVFRPTFAKAGQPKSSLVKAFGKV